jgi:hypothetical protein
MNCGEIEVYGTGEVPPPPAVTVYDRTYFNAAGKLQPYAGREVSWESRQWRNEIDVSQFLYNQSYPQTVLDGNTESSWFPQYEHMTGCELPQFIVIDMRETLDVSAVDILPPTNHHAEWVNGYMKDIRVFIADNIEAMSDFDADLTATKEDINNAYYDWVEPIGTALLALGITTTGDNIGNVPTGWEEIGHGVQDGGNTTHIETTPGKSGRYIIVAFPNNTRDEGPRICLSEVKIYGTSEQTYVPEAEEPEFNEVDLPYHSDNWCDDKVTGFPQDFPEDNNGVLALKVTIPSAGTLTVEGVNSIETHVYASEADALANTSQIDISGVIQAGDYYIVIDDYDGCDVSLDISFESSQPAAPVWDISAAADGTVTATIIDGVLTVTGTGAIKNFPVKYGSPYFGGGTPWFWDITWDADGNPVSATRSPYATQITAIAPIPEGITNIPVGFFYDEGTPAINADIMTGDLVLPSTIKSVGQRAFSHHNYSSITLPEGLETIGGNAFEGTSAPISSITIPSTVTSIGAHGLDMKLTEIKVKAATPPTITSASFASVNKETATVCVPEGKVEVYKEADLWKEFKNIGFCKEPDPEIPAVTLPLDSVGTFADDILPFLTGRKDVDHNEDGVIAVAFTIAEGGKLDVECQGYHLWLFDDPAIVSGDEILQAPNSIVKKQLEAGTYYLVIDDDLGISGAYNLKITFYPGGEGINTAGKAVKLIRSYDLLGRPVRDDAKGIVIQQITFDDGSIETKKEYRLD